MPMCMPVCVHVSMYICFLSQCPTLTSLSAYDPDGKQCIIHLSQWAPQLQLNVLILRNHYPEVADGILRLEVALLCC